MRAYHIRQWNSTFENAKSREREHCGFVCMPNKQDGLGLNRILGEPDGTAILGVWCLIIQACSRQGKHRDGWLTDDGRPDGRPWDVDDLSFRWRRSPAEIQRALDFTSSDKVGWLESLEQECPTTTRVVPDLCPRKKEGKEGTEGSARGGNPPPPVSSSGGGKTWGQLIREELAARGWSNNNTDCLEWFSAIEGVAGIQKLDEMYAFFDWVDDTCHARGITVKHRRHIGAMPDEWANGARNEHYRPKRKEKNA